MAHAFNRYRNPRICVDSQPTDYVYLGPIMSESNLACSSCMCGAEEDQAACCQSEKCAINVRRQQQTQTCCKTEKPEEYDINCPLCREAMKKAHSQNICNACQEKEKETNSCSICKQQSQNQAENEEENKCPKCKKQDTSASKIVEKELRCPSCSQPVAIKCCTQGSNPSIIVVITEKLPKDSSTNKRGDVNDDDTPCCQVEPKKEPKEPCCQVEPKQPCCKIEEPCSKVSNSQPNINKLQKNKSGCGMEDCMTMKNTEQKDNKSGCGMEDCVTMKKTDKLTSKPSAVSTKSPDLNRKDSKAKKEKSATESNTSAAADGNKCSCAYPPAYKQYHCTGQIHGTCDCTNQE